jgi:[ribosomal protein S18]-alanine N-acetyltransferase
VTACRGLVRLRPMGVDDLEVVAEIERLSFPVPWPIAAYRQEITGNANAHYYVASVEPVAGGLTGNGGGPWPEVVAYGGLWMQYDEAHVSTLAVHPRCRRRRIAERLLVRLIERAVDLGAGELTLEVRESNVAAQRLYEKYGFLVVGYRRRYYPDNGEDALIMTTPDVADEAWQGLLDQRRATLSGA